MFKTGRETRPLRLMFKFIQIISIHTVGTGPIISASRDSAVRKYYPFAEILILTVGRWLAAAEARRMGCNENGILERDGECLNLFKSLAFHRRVRHLLTHRIETELKLSEKGNYRRETASAYMRKGHPLRRMFKFIQNLAFHRRVQCPHCTARIKLKFSEKGNHRREGTETLPYGEMFKLSRKSQLSES